MEDLHRPPTPPPPPPPAAAAARLSPPIPPLQLLPWAHHLHKRFVVMCLRLSRQPLL